jgi:tetratricopeptide (TPR) repeat protein
VISPSLISLKTHYLFLIIKIKELSQKYRDEKYNLICGYNYGTCLVNNGEPRRGVEALLKVISLLPPDNGESGVINEQHLYYNLGIGLAYVGEWNSCFDTMKKIINPQLYAKAAMTRGKAAERMRLFDIALVELNNARLHAQKNQDWATASKGEYYTTVADQITKYSPINTID